MADLALGAARSVVKGTLAKVQSAIETEKKLRQVAQSDLAFINEEFQMVQSLLEVVDERRAKNKVVKTWVGQVRDLAYDVEDGMEFVAHLDTKPDWWHRWLLPCMARPLDEAVAELKQLKARVEAVSNRNTCYNLIGESGFKPITQQQLVPSAVMGETSSLDMLTEMKANAKMHQDFGVLTQLITNEGNNNALRVIWVWGTGDDLGFMSIVRKAYQAPDICQIFPCRGWFKLTHPFSPHEVLRSLMAQFYTSSCLQNGDAADVGELASMEEAATTQAGLINNFMKQANEKRYLVVLENVSTMGQWDAIRTYLPDSNNDSLVIMCTQQCEIANMCVADSYRALELKHYSACVLFKEAPQYNEDERRYKGDGEDEMKHGGGLKHFHRMPTLRIDAARGWLEQFSLVGRESLRNQLGNFVTKGRFGGWQVMSVCGIPGVGKSALVKYWYYERMTKRDVLFDKYSWLHVSQPFNLRKFCQSLLPDLHSESSQASGAEDPIGTCSTILKEHRCLVVVDDLHSDEEWDLIRPVLAHKNSRNVVIVITNDASMAMRCADNEELVLNVKCLERDAAIDVFKKECGGIPKVIVAIVDVLATKTVTAFSSARNLNARFIPELESNPDLSDSVRGIFSWMDSFIRTCPDYLKQCLLYLSIFPRQQTIRRRRLVRRWIAEGYCMDTESSSLEERAEWSFSKLVDLSMIQQPPHSAIDVLNYRMIFCQVNNFVGEYIFSQPMEEKLVLQLKGSCPLTTQSTGRHLVIDRSWDRDMIVFKNINFSRLRSMTVFGEWRSFFVSGTESMKVLRVLDLEDVTGVTDKDLEQMVKLLPRLKFLSLRKCTDIHNLPSSLGVLRQLETLDVRHTSIVTMPVTIAKLKKLQYLRAGTVMPTEERQTASSSSRLSELRRRQQVEGVKVATGIEKLTALHTLGVVNVGDAGGKAILKELRKLTQLRKLGVSGVNKKNINEFCSAISCHVHLESLSVRLSKDYHDRLNDTKLSPENLQSLTLFGFVQGLPAWIGGLHKLTKLDLEITISAKVDIHGVLGRIIQLCILRLHVKLLNDDDNVRLDFRVEMNQVEARCYMNVKILDIACSSSTLHVSFGSKAMENLEVLTARCSSGSTLQFSGLKDLAIRRLKEVRLVGFHDDNILEIRTQLGEHPNKPLAVKEQVSSRRPHRYST
uniref:NB-ARC domain-containing protein n=1 Tax=Setaria italica TaxID=4555 RepID=K3YZA8_SETIT